MLAKRAVASAAVKQPLFWALSANCVLHFRENCELKISDCEPAEFHGLSSIAQKNVQRAILLDECQAKQ